MPELSAVLLQEKDAIGTAELLAQVFGGTVDQKLETFNRQWTLNPAWSPDIPRGWIIRSDDGAILAHTTNIPFHYRINNAIGLCCATGGTVVHPDWRGRGLAKIVGEAFLKQKADLLVGVDSTPAAFNLWLALGMKPLDRSWARHHSIIGRIGKAVQNSFGSHTPSMLSAAADRALTGLTLFFRRRTVNGLAITRATEFYTSDDSYLNSCSASSCSTSAVRNTDVLNWLYFSSEYVRNTRVVLVARKGRELLGYIALKRHGDSLTLLECRCRDADTNIAAALFWAARDYADQEGIPYLKAWPYTKMLQNALPKLLSIPTTRSPMTYCYLSNVGAIDEKRWEATPGDGDLSIY
jgi:GNAT superfamily N-acetyltransferase